MKKEGTEKLWRICFGDKETFIRLFFDEVYKDENTFVVEKQGTVVAALQCVPYTLWIEKKEIPIAYICGVSTHPNERRNGWMGKLMHEADIELKKRGIPLATLIPAEPWLADIYRKYDYSDAFFYAQETYVRPSNMPEGIEQYKVGIVETPTPELFRYFDRKLRERKISVLHSKKDFEIIYKDLTLYSGKLLWLTNLQQEIGGMAFVLPETNKGELFMPEFLYEDETSKKILLYYATTLFNATKVNYKIPPSQTTSIARGMAKIIDPDYFRQLGINIQSLFIERQGCMTLMLD